MKELIADLHKRAESSRQLAEKHRNIGNVGDFERCWGKYEAYKYAAELLEAELKDA